MSNPSITPGPGELPPNFRQSIAMPESASAPPPSAAANASPGTAVNKALSTSGDDSKKVQQGLGLRALAGAASILKSAGTAISQTGNQIATRANKVSAFVSSKFTRTTTDNATTPSNQASALTDKAKEGLNIVGRLQELKEAGQNKLSQILNAKKQAIAEAFKEEALNAIAMELDNPSLPLDEKERLILAGVVIEQAQRKNGSINTDQIKEVLNQLNEGRLENDKIGQRFLIEDKPKPNKLVQAASQLVDLAKSKISEIKNRDAQKNAETMRKEVLGEIDSRIKAGKSSNKIDTARIIIVNTKREDGSINAEFIRHTLNELNKGLTDKIGEKYLLESQSDSTKNIGEKALSFLKDGFKVLSDKAVLLKERLLPKTSLEDIDKKTTDTALDSIKTEGRARAQVVSQATSDKIKKLFNVKNELLLNQDQNIIEDLRDAANSIAPLNNEGEVLSETDYVKAVKDAMQEVINRQERLEMEASVAWSEIEKSFSGKKKQPGFVKLLEQQIDKAPYENGRLVSDEVLLQRLDEIKTAASQMSDQSRGL